MSTNLSLIVPGAELYHLDVLSSALHMAWVRSFGRRLKSDYRYSTGIVYNNFPWPQAETAKQRKSIEAAAQGLLDARAKHPHSSLADLYDPLAMPADLVKAHRPSTARLVLSIVCSIDGIASAHRHVHRQGYFTSVN